MPSSSEVVEQVEEYSHLSSVNVSNFVSVKLSGKDDYPLWKTQMLCLIEGHDMKGFINPKKHVLSENNTNSNKSDMLWRRTDTLVRGWIFGSLTKDVLKMVANCSTAEQVWSELKHTYEEDSKSFLHVRAPTMQPIRSKKEGDAEVNELESAAAKDHWAEVLKILKRGRVPINVELDAKGLTALHTAVSRGDKANWFVKKFLEGDRLIDPNNLPNVKSRTGANPLHIAASYGNTYAAKLLVEKHPPLLYQKDSYDHWPIHKALLNDKQDTSYCLLSAMDTTTNDLAEQINGKMGLNLASIAISAGFHDIALKLIDLIGDITDLDPTELNSPMMAIAKRPWDLPSSCQYNFLEKFFYQLLIVERMKDNYSSGKTIVDVENQAAKSPQLATWVARCIQWLDGSVPLLKRIQKEKSHHQVALILIRKIFHKIYTEEGSVRNDMVDKLKLPIIEAAQTGAAEVIDVICGAYPKAISYEDKDDYKVFQLAILNRYEKVYSLMKYKLSDHNHFHKNLVDDCDNNILHLAARLGPSYRLNNIAGAALQMQYELHWFKEIEKFVNVQRVTDRNINYETPFMVFVREHRELWDQGEEWLKKTADSCTVSAALIVTIVFAAAISVPGGTDNSGEPIYAREAAFIVFALADAISLFTSTTSLLIFLSVLTSRFTELDFLVTMPKRLIFGLASLFISTTAMMVAFGATLYLMFGEGRSWILFPIAALACLPIASYVTFQFPLLVDLVNKTYYGPFSDPYNIDGPEVDDTADRAAVL